MGNCYLITSGNQSSAHGPTSATMDIYNIIISFNRKVFTMACLGLAPQRSWRSGLKYLSFLHPLSPIPFYFCIHTHPSPTYFPLFLLHLHSSLCTPSVLPHLSHIPIHFLSALS